MQTLAIVEFWLLGISVIVVCVVCSLYRNEHKQNVSLRISLEKAKASADYANALMELKDEANKKSREKNKKLDEGTTAERVNNAYAVLHDD